MRNKGSCTANAITDLQNNHEREGIQLSHIFWGKKEKHVMVNSATMGMMANRGLGIER